ncbi:hypothetical protein D6855_06615 [Butyrivibrio sp. CB08]|uniref:CgeB family protein n=1 Tax=Butyrivibrio sp. CB08 TaxID=2364879 RepID=UPI000EA89DAA|nr:DUF3880 domain-containing protein [Butyrivibrio sp. CB08]RKM60388.1 hypothetical protein D6855_06615 [Butyrivibrio sp. CB08]
MRILYYDWDEFNGEDCRDAMRRLGHQVETIRLDQLGGDLTPEIEQQFKKRFDSRDDSGKRYFDLVYSYDYFPGISEVCQKYDVPYVCWVFDCPHYPLFSPSIHNKVNRIFVFDRDLYKKLKDRGVQTVHHCPLAVNAKRLSEVCKSLDGPNGDGIAYLHDVCFLGSLYDNEFNFYDQWTGIPTEIKEYIEQVIGSQERVFGYDLFSDDRVLSEEDIERIKNFINIEDTGRYRIDYSDVIRDIFRKKVTVNERRNILTEMGKRFDTVVYTNPDAVPIPGVNNLGVVSYTDKMSEVFRRSKINLNISLRCITSGVSLRVMDVLAAGGFLLTTYTSEIAEYYEDGVDLAIARTPEEMIDKAAYYLEHEDERKEIAQNGQKKVFEKFAYTKILPEVLKL